MHSQKLFRYTNRVKVRMGFSRLLILGMMLCVESLNGRQQSPVKEPATHPAAKTPSPFAEARALLHEGRTAEAKTKILE